MSKSVPNQLRAFLNRSGLSMSSLARKMDRKAASSIQRYFSDDEFAGPFLSLPVAREFAKALAGTGDPAIGQAEVMALAGPDAPGQVAASVPEIDSIAAGEWGDITDPYPNGGAAAWIPITANVGPRAFALRITGRSMEPTYVEGDIVIVDPDIEPIPGDDVVAKIDGEERATFKRYRRRTPTEVELMPLNEMFPVLTIDKKNKGKIVGVMVEHHRYRHASR